MTPIDLPPPLRVVLMRSNVLITSSDGRARTTALREVIAIQQQLDPIAPHNMLPVTFGWVWQRDTKPPPHCVIGYLRDPRIEPDEALCADMVWVPGTTMGSLLVGYWQAAQNKVSYDASCSVLVLPNALIYQHTSLFLCGIDARGIELHQRRLAGMVPVNRA